jgi:hypothetical protein
VKHKLIALLCMLWMWTSPASAEPPIWESNYGTNLGLTDDSTHITTLGALNFRFPWYGATLSGPAVFSISSNGFVSLGGDNGHGCCSGDPGRLRNDPFGRIAAFWADLNPNAGGNVFLNTFDDAGDPETDRVVVTWDTRLFDNLQPIRAQLQMFWDGSFVLGWNGDPLMAGFDDSVLVGVSPGGGVTGVPGTDYSAAIPFHSDRTRTIYELWVGAPPPFDLDQTNLVFTPNGAGGFVVSSQHCLPRTWEVNYGTRLFLTDDSVLNTTFGAQALFSFPFAGTTYSSASVLSISSNGFVSLGGNNGDDCCTGNPAVLRNDPFARIAALWLDINPSGPGDVYIAAFNDWEGPAVDRLVVTWDTILFGSGRPIQVQLQMLSNGTISIAYRCYHSAGVLNNTLVGISPGGGAADPGSTDFTATVPFSSGAQTTIYELWTGVPPPFDLAGRTLVFQPNSRGGYHVDLAECARGTVNTGVAQSRDVLRINGSAGTPLWRVVTVPQNTRVNVSLAASTSGPATNVRYVLWAWPLANFRPTELVAMGQRIGCLIDPSPLHAGILRPFRCLLGSGMPAVACGNVQQLPAPAFAPWSLTRAQGFSNPLRVTLQGVMRDNGAANGMGFSVTNAVVLDIP